MTYKRKICFVGLDNYPILNPDKCSDYFGGESVQQTLLAKAFRDLGHRVSMVVKDHGQPQGEIVEGIQVWKTFDQRAGLPVLRFIYPRMTSLWAALRKADADVYYQSCAGMVTGVVALFCRVYKRTFVFRLASDSDCLPGKQIIRLWRDRKIYEYGLRNADLIAAQGIIQIKLLADNYRLDSSLVNMAVELPGAVDAPKKDIDVLWVNNLRDCKRPEMLLSLAELLPEYRIVMVGGAVPGHEELYEKIRLRAKGLPNLEFVGPIPYQKVNDYFSRARVFVNTSDVEGFPNSFLQAWVRYVPVVSFFDPDDLIRDRALGEVPSDLPDMGRLVRGLLSDNDRYSVISLKSRQFALEHYAPSAVAKSYEKLLSQVEAAQA
jgi:glycosyltransferase involved in cell wall biosynthesis